MASPLVQRQILLPSQLVTITSQTSRSTTTPPPVIPTTTSTTVASGLLPSVTGVVSDITSLRSVLTTTPSLAQPTSTPVPASVPPSSITPNSSAASSVPPTTTPPLLTTGSGGPVTITQTTPATSPSSDTSGTKGRSFLENKPVAGFVFGLSGLAVLILVFIAVTSFVRRRNRKRLLAEASNFSFDPRDVEDGTSDEKHSRSDLVGRHNSGHDHSDHSLNNGTTGFSGAGPGSISRPGPVRSPPVPAYIPQEYVSYDGHYPAQYHNLGNVPVGYNPTPNPYDMYAPRNGGGYSNSQVQHDPYNIPSSGGDDLSMVDPGLVPRQLQPGVRPAQSITSPPTLYNNSPPPLNHIPPIPSKTSPPPTHLRPLTFDQHDMPRLPTPGILPDTFGRRDSVGDDAYSGAFLGPESPPGQRTLQVANM